MINIMMAKDLFSVSLRFKSVENNKYEKYFVASN